MICTFFKKIRNDDASYFRISVLPQLLVYLSHDFRFNISKISLRIYLTKISIKSKPTFLRTNERTYFFRCLPNNFLIYREFDILAFDMIKVIFADLFRTL